MRAAQLAALGCLWLLLGCGDAASPIAPTSARSAGAFTESVGVNTHLGYDGTVYDRGWPVVRDRLVELGVRHVRDSSYREGTKLDDVVPRFNELAGLGVRGNLLAGDLLGRYGAGSIDEHLAWVKRNVPGFVESLEGPNENDYPALDANWAVNLRAYQCEWARKIRGDDVLSTKTVIGPASHIERGFDAGLGDLSGCLDRGNLHPYPGGQSPDRTNFGDLSVSLDGARSTSGAKPVWVTESGYHNAVNCLGCGHDPTSEQAAGVYLPRMFMENFRRGIPRTYAYELIDLLADPEKDDLQSNFGLLRNDGSRKPGFVGLRNVMRILSDSGSATGTLAYSLNCSDCPEAVRQVVLRKSTGDYYLVAWRETSVWNRTTRTNITNKPRYAELKLPSSSELEVFDPSRSSAPIETTTAASHRLALTDNLTIVKITPPTNQPPAPTPDPQTEPPTPSPTR